MINGKKVVAGISSMTKRKEALVDAVNSLVDQVDLIHLYLQEGHEYTSESEKVVIHRDYGVDMGDAGKFYKAQDEDCYFLSCDDDLIYPPDYAQVVCDGIEKYGGKVIVGFHGVIIKDNATHYYRDRKVFHGLDNVAEDKFVNLIGTCSCGFSTEHVKFGYDDCKVRNIADIWIALYAQETETPIVCLAHKRGWIMHTEKINLKETLFSSFHRSLKYPGNPYINRKWPIFQPKMA